jgi:hypothetical protein
MSSKTLFRLSGYALLIGFVLVLSGQLLQLALPPMSDVGKFYTDPLFLPSYLLFWSGAFLQVIGLPGLYARVAKKIGILGLLGFVFTLFGTIVIEIGIDLVDMGIFVPLAANPQTLPALKIVSASLPPGLFATLLLLFVGLLLFGIAMLRGRVRPRGVGIILIVSAIVAFASIVLPPIVDALGVILAHLAFAYGGFVLVRENLVGVPDTSPVSQVPSLS